MSDLRVATAARRRAQHPALLWDGGALSYEQLALEVTARARPELRGRRVVLQPEPVVEDVLELLAALEVGACPALLHPRWTPEECAAARARLPPPRAPGDVVVFTSGSSGAPRPVVLSAHARCAAAAAHAAAMPWEPGDAWLLAMPLAHVGGLSVLTRCLWACATVVLGSASAIDEALERHPITIASVVPTQLVRLLESGASPGALRAVLVGGAACPPSLLERGRAAGWPLLPTYGLSEACAQVCTQRLDHMQPEGVGRPLPGLSIRIRSGRIQVSGPTLMEGAEPWLDTGDRGRIDGAGALLVLGRADAMIVSGGENVDPLEVEAALLSHAGVRAAAVVGLDDARWGQRVAAIIVGETAGLEAHLEGRLARFKHPREWRTVASLPELPNGKVDRRAARELWSHGRSDEPC